MANSQTQTTPMTKPGQTRLSTLVLREPNRLWHPKKTLIRKYRSRDLYPRPWLQLWPILQSANLRQKNFDVQTTSVHVIWGVHKANGHEHFYRAPSQPKTQKHIQPIPEFDQAVEKVTEILVDNTDNMVKSILKKQRTIHQHGFPITTKRPNSKSYQSRNSTITIDGHSTRRPLKWNPNRRPHDRSRGPAKYYNKHRDNDLKQTTNKENQEVSTSRAPFCNETLLSPSFSTSQSKNEVEDPRHTTIDETNMQSESPPGVANDTPTSTGQI